MRVFVTHDAPGPQWQLGVPSPGAGAFALIGWESEPRDGGVPAPVVDWLAASLTGMGRVTFACSAVAAPDTPGWTSRDGDVVARYGARSVVGRIAARLSGGAPGDLTLRSSVSEASVARLFDDAGYPWWHQGQFALVSPAHAAPPDFATIGFDPATLFAADWSNHLRGLLPLGVEAMLRPGVDGDVAGLLCASSEVRDRFEAVMHRCALAVGASLHVMSGKEFIAAVAASPAGD